MEDQKRVFFGMEAIAPWPERLPEGHILEASDRHITLAFLGNTHFPSLEAILSSFPKPPFKVGFATHFTNCLFLPKKRPRVVAWEVEADVQLVNYHHMLVEWLLHHNLSVSLHDTGFLPHVTLCRKPVSLSDWREQFKRLPVLLKDIHLYESLGNSKYQSIWSHPLKTPFEKREGGYLIRGNVEEDIENNFQVALAFDGKGVMDFKGSIVEEADQTFSSEVFL